MLDLLIGKGPEAKLRKSDVAEAARHVLRREMTGPEYTKVSDAYLFKTMIL